MENFKLMNVFRKIIPPQLKGSVFDLLTSDVFGAVLKKSEPITSKGCSFFVDHPRISSREAASIFWGLRERAEVELVKNLLPVSPNLTIVEFGGSVGVVASHAVKRNPKGLVVIEADRELLDLCRINVNLNNVEDVDVVFLNFAVDYSDAEVTRFIPGATTTSGQLERTDQCRGLPMETTTLSQILDSQHIEEYVLISEVAGAAVDVWFTT